MSESQNVEYKESWRSEYLKWICGFANAQGGVVYIGINDSGDVVGVKNPNKLMEDIPNQIQSGIGILAEVNKNSFLQVLHCLNLSLARPEFTGRMSP